MITLRITTMFKSKESVKLRKGEHAGFRARVVGGLNCEQFKSGTTASLNHQLTKKRLSLVLIWRTWKFDADGNILPTF